MSMFYFPPVIFFKILVYAKFTEILYPGKTKSFLWQAYTTHTFPRFSFIFIFGHNSPFPPM